MLGYPTPPPNRSLSAFVCAWAYEYSGCGTPSAIMPCLLEGRSKTQARNVSSCNAPAQPPSTKFSIAAEKYALRVAVTNQFNGHFSDFSIALFSVVYGPPDIVCNCFFRRGAFSVCLREQSLRRISGEKRKSIAFLVHLHHQPLSTHQVAHRTRPIYVRTY